jgi:hypothetical protein
LGSPAAKIKQNFFQRQKQLNEPPRCNAGARFLGSFAYSYRKSGGQTFLSVSIVCQPDQEDRHSCLSASFVNRTNWTDIPVCPIGIEHVTVIDSSVLSG